MITVDFVAPGSADELFWDKAFDGLGYNPDSLYGIALDSEASLYAVGMGYFLAGAYEDWWIKKLDRFGAEVLGWQKTFDGNGGDDCAMGVAVDSRDDVYVVGYGGNIASKSSGFDWWIKKYRKNGNEYTSAEGWEKKITSAGNDKALAVAIDSADNVFVVGWGTNLVSAASKQDWWIKKFDREGGEDPGWDLKLDGGTEAYARSVAVDPQGNVVVVGIGTDLVEEGSSRDWWIVKFAATGAIDWQRQFDGEVGNPNDWATDVAVGVDGGVVVVGSRGDGRWWIKKLHSDGTDWLDIWSDFLASGCYARAVTITEAGTIYVAGSGFKDNRETWALRKFTPAGDEYPFGESRYYWTNDYYGPRYVYPFCSCADSFGNVFLGGIGANLCGASTDDDWAIRRIIDDVP